MNKRSIDETGYRELRRFLREEAKGLGRSEWGRSYRRAVDRCTEAVEAVAQGKVYDQYTETWKEPEDAQ